MKKNIIKKSIISVALLLAVSAQISLLGWKECPRTGRDKTTDIYDFTMQGERAECFKRDDNSVGNKSFIIENKSNSKVYVRIAYTNNCTATGFWLNPGQTGRIYKADPCDPTLISGYYYPDGVNGVAFDSNWKPDQHHTGKFRKHYKWAIETFSFGETFYNVVYQGEWTCAGGPCRYERISEMNQWF